MKKTLYFSDFSGVIGIFFTIHLFCNRCTRIYLSLFDCLMTEAVCRREGNNAAFVFTTLVSALVLVLFILSLYLPNRKPQKPRVQHIIPAVSKPEVFIVPVAETGPTAA